MTLTWLDCLAMAVTIGAVVVGVILVNFKLSRESEYLKDKTFLAGRNEALSEVEAVLTRYSKTVSVPGARDVLLELIEKVSGLK